MGVVCEQRTVRPSPGASVEGLLMGCGDVKGALDWTVALMVHLVSQKPSLRPRTLQEPLREKVKLGFPVWGLVCGTRLAFRFLYKWR